MPPSTDPPVIYDEPNNPSERLRDPAQNSNIYPFALKNRNHPRQRAFFIAKEDYLVVCDALDPSQWTALALKAGAIPVGATVRSYQVEISNLVLMRRGDGVVIAPTGYGKSLTWALPLLARQEGISLVIIPYTTLGLDGGLSNTCDGITSIFIYSEQNSLEDFEQVANGEMQIVYVCPEMLESPSFARILHSARWRRRLSVVYLDKAHLVHQTHHWHPPYSRIHQSRHILGDDIPFIGLSATCPSLYRDALVMYAGFKNNYNLINLDSHRPELSMIIQPMEHDISSFQDLAFVIPL
ncbi:P-loop containing nucleoside triphosphate hydrolase protein, partial [Mycena rosella]